MRLTLALICLIVLPVLAADSAEDRAGSIDYVLVPAPLWRNVLDLIDLQGDVIEDLKHQVADCQLKEI